MDGQNRSVDWDRLYDRLYSEFLASRGATGYDFTPHVSALQTLGTPTPEDIEWLVAGLKDKRKWFVWSLLFAAPKISGVFLEPLLDAGIAEMEASGGPRYTLLCRYQQFDPERMLNYLYSVIEKGDEDQKAGAVYCLYGLGLGFGYSRRTDLLVQKHRAELLLRTFLGTRHRHLRFAILKRLPFDIKRYPEELRPLVELTIASATDSEDEHERWFIRYRRARGTEEHNRIGAQKPGEAGSGGVSNPLVP